MRLSNFYTTCPVLRQKEKIKPLHVTGLNRKMSSLVALQNPISSKNRSQIYFQEKIGQKITFIEYNSTIEFQNSRFLTPKTLTAKYQALLNKSLEYRKRRQFSLRKVKEYSELKKQFQSEFKESKRHASPESKRMSEKKNNFFLTSQPFSPLITRRKPKSSERKSFLLSKRRQGVSGLIQKRVSVDLGPAPWQFQEYNYNGDIQV